MHQTWFEHGTGSGRQAVEYLLRRKNSAGVERAGVKVLRGDPDRLARLIDSLSFVQRYRSGSINFHVSDDPSEDEMQGLLDDHFSVACAGMNPDQVEWCSVLHEEVDGSRHMHLIFARVCLYTGLSFNPAAPGWKEWVRPLRDAWNAEKGWRRPERATALLRPPAGLRNAAMWKLGKDPRQLLSRWIGAQIDAGTVPDRDALLSALRAKVRINHVCEQYISVSLPDTPNQAIRLLGALYSSDYTQERAIALAREMCADVRLGRGQPDFILASEARGRLHKLAESRAEWNRTRYRRQDTENVDFTDRLDPWIHHVYLKQEPSNGIDRTRPKIDLTLDPQVRRERCGYSSVDRSAEGAVAVYDGLRREIERFDIIFGALNSAADRVESLLKRPAKIAGWDRHATMNVVVDSNPRLAETTVRVKSPALTMAAGTLLHQLIDRSGEMRDVLRQLAPPGHLAADQARRSLYEIAEALTTAYRLLLSNLHLAPLTESRMTSSSRYEGLQPHNATEWSEVLAAHDWHRLEKLAPALRMKVAELTGRLPEVWVARLPITASLRELTFVESEIHGMLDFLRSPPVASEESELSVITNRRAFSSKHAQLRTKDVRTSSLCESDEEERPRF